MKRKDYRTELKSMTKEQLKKWIDKQTAYLISETTTGYEMPSSTNRITKITYAENLLTK